jgi:hypothetical protein
MSEVNAVTPDDGPSKPSGKKDAKKAEKLAKFAAKTANKAASTSTSDQKDGKKDKSTAKVKNEEPEYVNMTPAGQKKGEQTFGSYPCLNLRLICCRYVAANG